MFFAQESNNYLCPESLAEFEVLVSDMLMMYNMAAGWLRGERGRERERERETGWFSPVTALPQPTSHTQTYTHTHKCTFPVLQCECQLDTHGVRARAPCVQNPRVSKNVHKVAVSPPSPTLYR